MATIVKPVEQKTKHLDYFLSQCHRRRYPAKSTIIYAGDKSDSLFYIVKGSVTVIIEDDDGREMIMAYLNAGDFFGEMGLFDNMDSRSAWVKAKTECEVAEISYTKFREIAQQDPRVLYFIGEQMASRLRQTTRKVGDLAFLDVTGRVARNRPSCYKLRSFARKKNEPAWKAGCITNIGTRQYLRRHDSHYGHYRQAG